MNIYGVNIIRADATEAAEHTTKLFLDKGLARDYLLEKEREWIAGHKKDMVEVNGCTEEEFENWLFESNNTDIDNDDTIYKHYIYSDGEEKIFELMTEEIEEFGVFIVKEDFRYMNNQCEIGSKVHLVTTNLVAATLECDAIKEELGRTFSQCEYTENVSLEKDLYKYEIKDESDVVTVIIERHEVK